MFRHFCIAIMEGHRIFMIVFALCFVIIFIAIIVRWLSFSLCLLMFYVLYDFCAPKFINSTGFMAANILNAQYTNSESNIK